MEDKQIHIYYEWEGERHHRTFPTKKQAFRWFHYLCPAREGEYVEEAGGVRSRPKRLRKRGGKGPVVGPWGGEGYR